MSPTPLDEINSVTVLGFPPGASEVWAEDDGDGGRIFRHLKAAANTVLEKAVRPIEELDADISPLSCGAYRLRKWEETLDLVRTRTALWGTTEARRRAVIARLREYGAPTRAQIQAVLGPLLDYPDPSLLVVLECDRAGLRLAHTYSGARRGAGGWTHISPAVWDFWVNDADRVAPGCVQADCTLTTADLSTVGATLVAPDGSVGQIPVGALGRGGAAARPTRLFFHGITTQNVLGLWSVLVFAGSAPHTGTLDAATLFCEGFGRRGLASPQFEWAVVYEPSKSS